MTISSEHPASLLDRKLFWRITPTHLLLTGIILLSVVLHFWDIAAIGTSNKYYTAAVESMTQSWHNFFYAAAEPGGSVTVDKPPLGLWIETLFALVLGVSGFSTSLPNILAGILSVPLLYHLVRKYLGKAAGLLAGLVMAVTPVVFATDRNNTADGMLTFVLLLAAWTFLAATESGKLRHLLLGAFLVGLGFNIKMMQAFLPLPAFYALYFFASKNGWGRKLLQLGLATVLLIVVSLSWAVAVDLTPADQRPYIGSSDDNSVMGLIIGYNGLQRLLGGDRNAVQRQATAQGADAQGLPPNGQVDGNQVPPGDDLPAGAPAGAGGVGGAFSNEVGLPGLLRFFQTPLAKEMSWLLPFALAGILLALFVRRIRLPLESGIHKALLLWGGWLVTCLVFFSIAKFFHAYYMIMLVPALGGAVGLGYVCLKELKQTRPALAAILLVIAAMLTIGLQICLVLSLSSAAWWLALPVAALVIGAVIIAPRSTKPAQAEPAKTTTKDPLSFTRLGYVVILLAMIIIPLAWSMLTVLDTKGFAGLPGAYAGNNPGQDVRARVARGGLPTGINPYRIDNRPAGAPRNFQPPVGTLPNANPPDANPGLQNPMGDQVNDRLLIFLQENTQDVNYLVAVPSAQVGASLVIQTGRPVLYMGGFNGGDPVIDAQGLAELVADGELRFVLYGNNNRNTGNGIARWLRNNCNVVTGFGTPAQNANGTNVLFRCGTK